MPAPQHQLPLPGHLQHKPVLGVPFFDHDPGRESDTDCQYLSIGWAQWNDKEIAAKVFRHGDLKWSRQSEELPLARLIDLASLAALAINNGDGDTLTIPAGFFENQPDQLEIQRYAGNDAERQFYRLSFLNNELLQRRLDKLTDILVARRDARATP